MILTAPLLICIVLLAILCGTLLYSVRLRNELKENVLPKKVFKIAIVTSLPLKNLGAISSFISYIKKYAAFNFEIIECIHAMDRQKAVDWINFAADSAVHLIVAVGRLSVDTAYTTLKTREHKPQVIGMANPAGFNDTPLELIQSTMPFTAVSMGLNWPEKLAILKKLMPNIKKVLIVFRSVDEISHSNLREKNAIIAGLRKLHISWEMLHIANIEKECGFTKEIMHDVDVVLLSYSSEVMRFAGRICQEAQALGRPVCSINTVLPEIFLSINMTAINTHMGRQAAQYTINILEDNIDASKLPLKEINNAQQVILHHKNTDSIRATTIIGNLLAQSNHLSLKLELERV